MLRVLGWLPRSRREWGLVLLFAGMVALAVALVAPRERSEALRLVPRKEPARGDPLAFDPRRRDQFERAAAFGLSHVLYEKSPGGVIATAGRVARFRPLIERAIAGSAVGADSLEALVFLESAGRPEVIAGGDPAGAAGLTQIVAETASRLLDMHVDLAASRRLTRRLDAALRRGNFPEAARLRVARRRVDARFRPAQALAGSVRYLSIAGSRFGRSDLAVVSYHMGIANLERVLRLYADAPAGPPIATLVRERALSYARVYFDSSPLRHSRAWQRLTALGDESRNYLWKLFAAREIMHLFRTDRRRLERLARLHAAKASAEELLHPPDESERFAEPADLERAWREGKLQLLPGDPQRLYVRLDAQIGTLAGRLDAEPALYHGLRAEALALLLYVAARVHAISGASAPLILTSAVRDERYQRLLADNNSEATRAYSLHTTGYAFDILRSYASLAQAAALQFMLERLEALGMIAWVREPTAIHVTVAGRAALLIPSLLQPAG
jgi:hypothetical protein